MKQFDPGNLFASQGFPLLQSLRKKKSIALAFALGLMGSHLSAQTLLSEDFSTAVDSITPPTGWMSIDSVGDDEVWRFDNPGALTLNNPISSPAAIFDSDYYGSAGGAEEAYLISPEFDATTVNFVMLSFDHYFRAGYSGSAKVQVFDGSDWVTVHEDSASSTSNPQSESINITSYVTGLDSSHVRFKWTGDYSWYWIVDNVLIENITCLPVTSLDADSITNNSAMLSWAAGSTETQWELEYGPSGFTQGSGTISTESNDSVSISGLTGNTAYEFYVRAICGAGDSSTWAGPFAFSTLCDVYSVPFFEDFTSFAPDCWTEAGSGTPATGPTSIGSSDWLSDDFGNVTTNSDAARLNLYYNNDEEWLITPRVDLTSGGPHWLEFDFAITDYGNSGPSQMGSDDTVQVVISADDGATWTALMTWDASSNVNPAGQHVVIDLAAYDGDSVHIAFWGTDGSVDDPEDYDVFVDNVSINTAPACASFILNFNAITTSSSTAYISYDSTGTTASSFLIEYGPTGFIQGSGTMINDTLDSINLTGLTPGSNYEVYLAVICASGDTGIFTGPVAFSTFYDAPYFENFDGISNGSQADFGNGWTNGSATSFDWHGNSGGTTSSSTGPSGDHTTGSGKYVYTEATDGSTGDTASLYSPMIEITSLTNPYASFWYHRYGADLTTAYVDLWNGSAWITVDSLTGQSQSAYADPYLLREIDLTAYTGVVQMRIWSTKDGFAADFAIDDFSLFSKPNTDLGVLAFAEPEDLCGDSATELNLIIHNYGIDAQTGFDVQVDVSGSATFSITYTYSGTLAAGATDTVAVDTLNTALGGTFNMIGYTVITGDENNANDSSAISGVVIVPAIAAPGLSTPDSQSVCIGGDATFAATGISNSALWTDTAGVIVSKDDTLQLDSVTAAGTYYLYDAILAEDSLGLVSHIGTSGFITSTTGYGLGFNVSETSVIEAVTVFPQGSGTIQIRILDQATNAVVYTGPVTAVTGPASLSTGPIVANVVPVGAQLEPGNYKMGMSYSGITSLIRDTGAGGFPYTSSNGAVSILGGSTGGSPTSSTYYWFYDWKIITLGCRSEAVEVSVDLYPTVVVDLGADTAYCEGETFNLTLDAGNATSTFDWSTGATSQTINVDTAGTYWVEVSSPDGCLGFDTLVVVENAVPVVDLGSDTAYCANEIIAYTLDAGNAGATFMWSDGSTGQSIVADTAGNFWVEVTVAGGCSETDTVIVIENAVPSVDLGSDTAYCENEAFSMTLDAGNATSSFFWNDSSTNQTLAITEAGTYWVEVTSTEGCSYIDSMVVTSAAAPVVSLGNDTSYCDNEGINLMLDAGNAGASYTWQDNSTSQTFNVVGGGMYHVTVVNAAGCTDVDSITVTALAAPVLTLDSVTACEGEMAIIDAGAGYTSYLWGADSSTGQTLAVDSAGLYSVTVWNAAGCSDEGIAEVIFNETPLVDLGNDTTIHDGNTVVLDAGNAGSTYAWSTGDSSQSIGATLPGTYVVEVTNGFGCTGSDTITVDVIYGINDLQTGNLSFYPNPTSGEANLVYDLRESGELTLSIYSMNGQLVQSISSGVSAGTGTHRLDVSGLSSGLYFIDVKLDGSSLAQLKFSKL